MGWSGNHLDVNRPASLFFHGIRMEAGSNKFKKDIHGWNCPTSYQSNSILDREDDYTNHINLFQICVRHWLTHHMFRADVSIVAANRVGAWFRRTPSQKRTIEIATLIQTAKITWKMAYFAWTMPLFPEKLQKWQQKSPVIQPSYQNHKITF